MSSQVSNNPFGPEPPGSDKRRADNLDCENGVMSVPNSQTRVAMAVPGSAARQQIQPHDRTTERLPTPGQESLQCPVPANQYAPPATTSTTESESEYTESPESSSDGEDYESNWTPTPPPRPLLVNNTVRRDIRRQEKEYELGGVEKYSRRRRRNPAEERYGSYVKFHYEYETSNEKKLNDRSRRYPFQIGSQGTRAHGHGQSNRNECAIHIQT